MQDFSRIQDKFSRSASADASRQGAGRREPFSLPSGVTIRFVTTSDVAGAEFRFWLLIWAAETNPSLKSFFKPGMITAVLTHDIGVSWPDTWGETLAAEALQIGGLAAFGFASKTDARACERRLRELAE